MFIIMIVMGVIAIVLLVATTLLIANNMAIGNRLKAIGRDYDFIMTLLNQHQEAVNQLVENNENQDDRNVGMYDWLDSIERRMIDSRGDIDSLIASIQMLDKATVFLINNKVNKPLPKIVKVATKRGKK